MSKHISVRRLAPQLMKCVLGPPARCPFTVSFLGEGSPTTIDYRKKGTLILNSPLEDLVFVPGLLLFHVG